MPQIGRGLVYAVENMEIVIKYEGIYWLQNNDFC